MRKTALKLWEAQIAYNKKIRQLEHPDNKEYWTKQYLLGIVSEIDEVLQEINWKIHRRGHTTDRNNLGRELADMTKYIWCLWELHGFSEGDMYDFIHDKTEELEAQHSQDFVYQIPPKADVVITDIDGTIGDWRNAFRKWTMEEFNFVQLDDPSTVMSIDVDLKLEFPTYYEMKEKFEAEGGYRLLQPYPGIEGLFNKLKNEGTQVVVYTARPADRYSRIWSDTWHWLKDHKLYFTDLRIGSDERISQACRLQKAGHAVVMLEDDPSLALRAASSNIIVLLRSHPYNEGVEHKNIQRVSEFTFSLINHFLFLIKYNNLNKEE